MPSSDPSLLTPVVPGAEMKSRIAATGQELASTLLGLLDDLEAKGLGPQRLADLLGLDKVLTSRLLKAIRSDDLLGVVYHMPGPAPLRRVLKAFGKRGVESAKVARATEAVERFELLIRDGAGDRSSLDAIISTWVPEARAEIELRRRQSAYKAMSHLRGASVDTNFSAALLSPAEDGEHIDIVWVIGVLGLRRLRPNVECKFGTRRMADEEEQRRPMNLDGEAIVGIDRARLDQFCFAPPAPLVARRIGDTLLYTLGDAGFGPRSNVDIVFAEVNRQEIRKSLPAGSNRKGFYFADVQTPTKSLHFDVFVHDEIYAGSAPELFVYDTSVDGVADVNDPIREIDRYQNSSEISHLGRGLPDSGTIPNYRAILQHVFDKLGWSPDQFRGYRRTQDFPIYGSQHCLAFQVPEREV